MSAQLIVLLVCLGSVLVVVFLVGFAAGRASRRRPVVVQFPELPPIPLKPTTREVAAATDDDR